VACWPAAAAEPQAAAGGAWLARATSALDATALSRLQALDPDSRNGLVERVLTTYAQSLERLLDQLQAARGAGDEAAIRHAAHTLKSSSASVGALALSSMCAQVEAVLREGRAGGDRAAFCGQLDQLAVEAQRILSSLRPA
jgi:HPt (histidine-containing phosphotransfer) domain-containing protein